MSKQTGQLKQISFNRMYKQESDFKRRNQAVHVISKHSWWLTQDFLEKTT